MGEQKKEFKAKLIEMLSWYHNFCVENGLRYFAICGTMLGAARHEGMIPWDDDIDVGMPLKDYERFIELTKDLDGKYVVETPDTPAKDYFYPYIKIYDTTTTYIERTKHEIKRGIFLDVFPLCGAGESFEESRKLAKSLNHKYMFLITRITGLRRENRKWYKNALVLFFRIFPQFIINDKKLLKNIVKAYKKKDYDECSWVGNFMSGYHEKECMPKEVYGTPALYKFEDIEIYGVEKADEYLTNIYGDWRTPPPEDKRTAPHYYLEFDLNKSYLEK